MVTISGDRGDRWWPGLVQGLELETLSISLGLKGNRKLTIMEGAEDGGLYEYGVCQCQKQVELELGAPSGPCLFAARATLETCPGVIQVRLPGHSVCGIPR